MDTQPVSTLKRTNAFILQCQDEAYSLAYYMTGGKDAASTVVQGAFQQMAAQPHPDLASFRLEALQRVAAGCQEWRGRSHAWREAQGFTRRLADLPHDERLVLILVEMLGLGYSETAAVTRQPVPLVSRRLSIALARLCADRVQFVQEQPHA